MMSNEHGVQLPAGVEQRLDQLLAQWAGKHRLTAAAAAAIRRQILVAPAEFGFEWWWHVFNPAGVGQSQIGDPSAVGSNNADELASEMPGSFFPWASPLAVTSPDYQPYFRFA